MRVSENNNLEGAPMLGDHLAIDLLNTQARSGDNVVEYWHSDADVLRWLRQNDIYPAVEQKSALADGELLSQAKELRALAHQLITTFKQQKYQISAR
jgi:hypothetical protein